MPVPIIGGPPPPRPPGPAWDRMSMTWTGGNEKQFTLTDPAGGVFMVSEGIRGLAMPPLERFTSESAALAGASYRGSRVKARDCFWPLYLYSDFGSASWGAFDADFWSTMRPDVPGVWAVTHPISEHASETRYLTVRFADDGDKTFERDPFLDGWTGYGIHLIADRPFWRGPVVRRVWKAPTEDTFFSGPGVINIAPADTFGTATMPNLGDEPARMVWTVTGPVDAGTVVGIPGATITLPDIDSGKKLTIDTNPDRLDAIERDTSDVHNDTAGVDRTDDLGDSAFASIPAGNSVELSMTIVGGGPGTSVTGELEPLYWRAW